MTFWLLSLVLLLSLITYFIVQRNVASITRTPVWLLWLVMMTPALIWSTWTLIYGENKPMPPELVLGPFVICPLLYWLLIQWGRLPKATKTPSAEVQHQTSQANSSGEAQMPRPAGEQPPSPRPITKAEETSLQGCFPWSVYYVQNIEYRPQAVICRGQLRTNPEAAYNTVRQNIESQFGDRFLVVFQESFNGKPFFALVPNPQARQASKQAGKQANEPLTRPFLALGLLLTTLFTTTLAGVRFAGIDQPMGDVLSDPALLRPGLPYALALLLILGVHESGHYLATRFYKIRATLPYFIPIPFFLGTFGAFIQIRSPIPNRKALFDVGIAGPLSGLVATMPLLWWGLAHSSVVPAIATANILDFNVLNPTASLMLTLMSKLALGDALTVNTAIKLHPVAIAGCLGLVVTALNLMPVGQLDGGHIVHAMFGQRTGAAIGQVARLLVLVLSLVQPDLLPWAILLFFMPVVDEPALNDVSELDGKRDLWGLFALSILLLIVLPAPRFIAQALSL